MPDMLGTMSAPKVPVGPRMRYTIVIVIATGVVTNPLIPVYVGVLRVAILIFEVVMHIILMRIPVIRLRSMPRRNSAGISQKFSTRSATVHIL
jgi:hypothetical protein